MTEEITTSAEISVDQIKAKMQKLEALRNALIKGENSGIAEDYSIESVQHQLDSEFEER